MAVLPVASGTVINKKLSGMPGRWFGRSFFRRKGCWRCVAFEVMHAARVTLGVFDNNPAACGCYKAVGFREAPGEESDYAIMGETGHCVELVMNAGASIL